MTKAERKAKWAADLEQLNLTLAEDNGPLVELEGFLTPLQRQNVKEKYVELSLYLERVAAEVVERYVDKRGKIPEAFERFVI